jgi:phenylpropionate dioxygenase-like ring-hydroxylating dioxygenase large terminal subunit
LLIDRLGQDDAVSGDRIADEWFPVATAADVTPGSWHPFELLDDRYVLICDRSGQVVVARDTCPHRGAQLSLGTFDGTTVQCPYHGWRFASAGQCVFRPAHPDQDPPPFARLSTVASREAYGLWWACVGPSPRNLPVYDAYAAYPGLTVTLGPKTLNACGPRIVENFLDMAHFPFVHADYLGQVPHTEVRDYDVARVGDHLEITNCVFWQPNPGPTATEGGDVAYEYGVSHPYAAILTKIPSERDGGELGGFSLLLVASPVNEFVCRVWMLTTVRDPQADLASFNAFNAVIFGQDIRTVESQRPKRLPVDNTREMHQRADKASLAYRKWLVDRGVRYGTSLNDRLNDRLNDGLNDRRDCDDVRDR